MDWYYGSGGEDLVVPRDQEPLDRLPSPNSWSVWGASAPQTFKSANKYFITQKSLIEEEPNFNGDGLYEEVDTDLSPHEAEHSSNSNLYQGFQEGSLQQATSPWESPDYELSDLSTNNRADDIFMSSLLEEDSTDMDNVHGSFDISSEYEYGVLPADNLLVDMITESDFDPSQLFGTGSSNYHTTHLFSPSMDWGQGEVTPRNLRQTGSTPRKALVSKFAASSEVDIVNGFVNEETSLEDSVLHELEGVMVQFSEKTRICFRDALYRLAKSTEQHTENRIQSGDLISDKLPQLTVHDEPSRLENTKAMESETNAIDRAVANLLFSKTDSEPETTGQYNYSLSQPQPQPQPPHYPPRHTSLAGDAEVPIFG